MDFFKLLQADQETLAAAGVQMPNVYGYRGAAKQKPVGTPYGKWRERTYRKLLRSNSYIRELRDDEAWRQFWSGDSRLRDLLSPKSKPGRFLARAHKAQSRMWGNYGQRVAEYLWFLESQPAPAKMKMRVCGYRVVGLHSGQEMPSTVMDLKEDIGSGDGASDEILPDEHPKTESPQPLSIPRRYQKYASMDASDLLQLPLEFLRELAGRAFKIVGASKVRGGKTELVRLIEEVRGR